MRQLLSDRPSSVPFIDFSACKGGKVIHMGLAMYIKEQARIGGFEENDGTIDFYLRIRSIVTESSVILDLGAGRGRWFEDDKCQVRHEIRHLTPLVKRCIAADVDTAVVENRASTDNILIEKERVPLEDSTVDVIVADYVLEHIDNPESFVKEVDRLLKPGGYFCARTPHKYNYVSIIARLIGNRFHKKVLKEVQPFRKPEDVFDTAYKLNTLNELSVRFVGWDDNSFIFRSSPSYYFGSKILHSIMSIFHRIAPLPIVGCMFVFIKKQ